MNGAVAASSPNRWATAWPDAVAFTAGLGLAWWLGWNTTDLVWSLWLASLVVGYAMIGWGAFSPAMLCFREGRSGAAAVAIVGGLAMLAFFTVHFGIFHAVHAAFLNLFFPIDGSGEHPGANVAWEVVRRYGWFPPIAVLAERRGFRIERLPPEPPATSVKAADIDARKARQALGWTNVMMPYKNVVRMHLLIFFFAAARFLKLENFAVYAVVYAVYFFPWRLVMRPVEITGGKPA